MLQEENHELQERLVSPASWLLFFSSLPSRPVGNRVKVWRRLMKAGAAQLRGTVYILPDNRDHEEFFQGLAVEIGGMGGEAAFVRTERIEAVSDAEVAAIFERRKARDYRPLAEALALLERKIDMARQGGRPAAKTLQERLAKVERDFEETLRTDFFTSKAGKDIDESIARARAALSGLAGALQGMPVSVGIPGRSTAAYHNRLWVTRRGSLVDRTASAWLIRTFIDPAAMFGFVDEEAVFTSGEGIVAYAARGGEFIHVDDLCTFEVLVRSFALKETALARIAEIVHDLDAGDDHYRHAESPGVKQILQGARRTACDDTDALERGMAVFEMLYAAGSR